MCDCLALKLVRGSDYKISFLVLIRNQITHFGTFTSADGGVELVQRLLMGTVPIFKILTLDSGDVSGPVHSA